jgi:hypothetical protein
VPERTFLRERAAVAREPEPRHPKACRRGGLTARQLATVASASRRATAGRARARGARGQRNALRPQLWGADSQSCIRSWLWGMGGHTPTPNLDVY